MEVFVVGPSRFGIAAVVVVAAAAVALSFAGVAISTWMICQHLGGIPDRYMDSPVHYEQILSNRIRKRYVHISKF